MSDRQGDQPETVSAFTAGIAGQIGEDPTAITAHRDISQQLEKMQEGVLVALHIEGARRFWKKLSPQDLGLAVTGVSGVLGDEASKVISEYLQLGRLGLLPKDMQDRLQTIERSARYCLQRRSFKTHWGTFVPVTLYEEWKAENAGYEHDFNEFKDELIERYDEIVATVIANYRPLAEDAYQLAMVGKSLLKNTGGVTDEIIRELVQLLSQGEGKEAFIRRYLESIRTAIRSREEVAASFRYVVELSVIPLPSLLARDMEQAERLYGERAIKDATTRAELERIEAQRRIDQAKAYSEEQAERDRHWMLLRAEQDRIEAQQRMERDILNAARQDATRLLAQFNTDVVGQINDQLQLICSNVLDSLSEHNGQLRGPVSRQLRNVVEQLAQFNFMDNQGITAMLEEIRGSLPTQDESEQAAKGKATIDTTRLQIALRHVQTQARDAVIDLGLTPSQKRARSTDVIAEEALIEADTRRSRPGEAMTPAATTGQRRRRKSAVL
jgi:hypothetical protein